MKLPRTSHLERLPSPDPSPEELTIEFADMDEVYVTEHVDRDCRYAQKVAKRRKKLFGWAMRRIPREEREAVKLSLMGKSQREIAAVQGISQVTVLERLKRAQRRLAWLCNVRSTLTPKQLRHATRDILRAEDRRILVLWWETGSQSEVARRVYGDARMQKRVQLSVLHAKTVLKNIKRMQRVSNAIESLWENTRLLIDHRFKKDDENRRSDLSPRTVTVECDANS